MKLFKLIKYDFTNGLWRKALLYLAEAALCFAFFADFYRRGASWDDPSVTGGSTATLGNFLIYLFAGREPFDPEMDNAFVFPVVWLLIFLYGAFVTLDYPYGNLAGHGVQVMLRVRDRKSWWLSKCVWAAAATVIYFAMIYVSALVLCLVTHTKLTLENVPLIADTTMGQRGMLLFILPVMTALAVNFIQLCLGLFMDRVYGYMITALVLFASTYFQSPLAIGNFAMVKRSCICSDHGMTISQGLLVNGFWIAAAVVVGFVRIQRLDMMKKGKF